MRSTTLEGNVLYVWCGSENFPSKAKELAQGARLALSFFFFVVSDQSSIVTVTSRMPATSALMIKCYTLHITHRDWKCQPTKQMQDESRFLTKNRLCGHLSQDMPKSPYLPRREWSEQELHSLVNTHRVRTGWTFPHLYLNSFCVVADYRLGWLVQANLYVPISDRKRKTSVITDSP